MSTLKKRGAGEGLHHCIFFFHYAKFQFACSEINVQVRQRNKLAYNLHLRKKKISNSVPTLILNTKYKQIITWCFSFLLHFRYRYKQCDIQTSKFTAMSTSLIDFTSRFLEALYPTVDELVQAVWIQRSSNASQHPLSFPVCLIQGLVANKICATYWRWLQKK